MRLKLHCISILTCLLTACNNEVDQVYSCNSSINTWTIENLEKIQEMSRNDWNNLDEMHKLAAYRAFTQKQRIIFWHKKLEEVLTLDWTEGERQHICLVDSFIDAHPDFLSGKRLTDDQLNVLETFFYLWTKNAKEKFRWSTKTAISIAGSGNSLIDKKGNVRYKNKEILKTRGNCHCNTSILSDFCNGDGICKRTMCEEELLGCGWILVQSCNGECSGIE